MRQQHYTSRFAETPYESAKIGPRLREVRLDAGIKQSTIARELGVDPAVPSTWEGGARYRPVPGHHLPALAGVLHCAVSDLLSEDVGAEFPTAETPAALPEAPQPWTTVLTVRRAPLASVELVAEEPEAGPIVGRSVPPVGGDLHACYSLVGPTQYAGVATRADLRA